MQRVEIIACNNGDHVSISEITLYAVAAVISFQGSSEFERESHQNLAGVADCPQFHTGYPQIRGFFYKTRFSYTKSRNFL